MPTRQRSRFGEVCSPAEIPDTAHRQTWPKREQSFLELKEVGGK